MDTVLVFNTELSGLYETRPPISKAKMAAITKSAMKAIKFYKHVVQSVEKFILKCKPEYKVPGLYVIDSIVRQSRHQFGADKDVFAPRFARNMQSTFVNLFRCAPEDKSRIIRVLNLWQKNNVFAPEVIQPLFDLANPNHPMHQNQPPMGSATMGVISGLGASQQEASSSSNGGMNNMNMNNQGGQETPPSNMQDDGHTMSSDMSGPTSAPSSSNHLDSSTMRQLQQLQQLLLRQTAADVVAAAAASSAIGGSSSVAGPVPHPDAVHFGARQMMDFHYGDMVNHHHSMDDGHASSSAPGHASSDNSSISKLLNDPTVLRQLQTLQKLQQQEDKQSKLNEMRAQDEAFEKHLATVLKQQKLPFANECDLSRQGSSSTNDQPPPMYGIQSASQLNSLLHHQQQQHQQQHQQQMHQQLMMQQHQQQQGGSGNIDADPEVELVSDDGKVEVINLDSNSRSPSPADRGDRYISKRRRSRSRSPRRRRRSRSPRSRSPRGRRNRSRDRTGKDKDKDREREKEREHDRERRRKGLPELKKEHLSVCSTTLWVGHLSKLVHQEELSDTFGKYGDIVSIDMIHPRGCAFIVMNRRQDAYKAMGGLKNQKMQGRMITISWAAGKGVKSKEWKDYWDLDLGVSYVPWTKLSPGTDFDSLEEGGMFDDESMPGWLRDKNQPGGAIASDPIQPPHGLMFPGADTTQPPPVTSGPPPPLMPPIVNPFSLGNVQRMINPLAMHMPPNMVPGLSMGVPPPQMLMQMPPMPLDKSIPPPTGAAPPGFMSHFPPMPGTMPPQLPTILPPTPLIPTGGQTSDDHMDIEMEDDNKPPPAILGIFNRPPPSFGPASGAPPPPFVNARDRDGSRDRRRDRSNSHERRSDSRERDFRSGDRDGRGRDERRHNDFSSRSGGDRGGNSRWGNEDRSRSRDLDQQPRSRRGDSRERNSRDRTDKPLHDRLRDMAAEGNGMIPVDGPPQPWREVSGPPGGPGNFNPNMNFMDQGPRGMRPMHMMQMVGGPPGMGPNFRGGNEFDFNNRGGNDFDRRGPPPRDMFGGGGNINNPFGPGPRGGPMGGRGGPFGPRGGPGGPGGPMFMRGPRPGPHGGPPGPGVFNDRPFFDGPDRGFDRNQGSNDGRGGGRVSRGTGGDRDRARGPWNERQNEDRHNEQPNDDKETSKRTASRWAINESSSPTVVSEEEDWDDEETINEMNKNIKKHEELNPLPQTEPIDDDSQEDDFNDFEEDDTNNQRTGGRSDPVAIVEIPDESSSPIEIIPSDEVPSDHSTPEIPCENTTPLYDEPQSKNKSERALQGERQLVDDQNEQETDEAQQKDNTHFDQDEVTNDQNHGNEEPDEHQSDGQEYIEQEPEGQHDEIDDQDRASIMENVFSEENMQNGDNCNSDADDRSGDDQASAHGHDVVDDEEQPRCPTPDAHIESEQEECNAGSEIDAHHSDDDDANQSD